MIDIIDDQQRFRPPKHARQTNGDRIRQMTDEELAAWLAPRMLCRDCPLRATEENLQLCANLDCKKAALEYLLQEARDL